GELVFKTVEFVVRRGQFRFEGGDLLALLDPDPQRRRQHHDEQHEDRQRHDREPGQADATQPVRGWGRPRHGDGNLLRPLPSTHATSLTCVSRRQPLNRGKALRPAYTAAASSSSSMRSSWLYLATRSER